MAKVQEAYSERDQKINAKGEVIEGIRDKRIRPR